MRRFSRSDSLRPVGFVAILWTVVMVCAACGAATPASPAASSAPARATALPASTVVSGKAAAAAPASNMMGDVPVGVDSEGHFYRGNRMATVKMSEFTDFQCPFCARHASQTGPQLEKTYLASGQVLQIFRNYPIPSLGHKNAVPAALAARCAGLQNPAFFWGMYDWLFANQKEWAGLADAPSRFREQVRSLGADIGLYDACISSPDTNAAVVNDVKAGNKLGVRGTPSFFINDWSMVGAYPFSEFQKVIGKALQGIPAPPTRTPTPKP